MTFDHYIGFETYVPNYLSTCTNRYTGVFRKPKHQCNDWCIHHPMIYRSMLQRVSFFEFWKTRFIFRHTPVKKFISRDYIYYKYRL